MSRELPALQRLLSQLQKVPYLASKNLYRVALHLLTTSDKSVTQLCEAILDAKQKLKPCVICCNWTEGTEECAICSSSGRDKTIICVVETWLDLQAIEKMGDFRGVYHVLGGALCPLEGIGPDNLSINALVKRITPEVRELIFATNPTPEGEATASFISSKIMIPVQTSKLASGVPIGASLEYMDRITIHKALSGRRPF